MPLKRSRLLAGERYELLQQAFARLYCGARGEQGTPPPRQRLAPPVSFEFYPYTTLKHTIRFRRGMALVRISDILSEAPLPVLEAVLAVLVYKALNRPVPDRWRQLYEHFIAQPTWREKVARMRRLRGSKKLGPPAGKFFDLDEIFHRLNQSYFHDRVVIRRLGWSLSRPRRTLGHYDPAHRTITVSRRLDHPLVPLYVVEFVVYHEMLHAVFDHGSDGRRRFHHSDFRKAEQAFKDYRRARAFIEEELC